MIDTSAFHNSFFSGGLALGVLGAAGMWLRGVWSTARSFIWRKFITTLEIRDNDPAYEYVQEWLNSHPYSKKNKLMDVNTTYEDGNPRFMLIPSQGNHFFIDGGRLYWITKKRDKLENSSGSKAYSDTLYIETPFGDKDFMEQFLVKCHAEAVNKSAPKIYVKYYSDGWFNCNSYLINSTNRLIMTDSQSDMLNDAVKFIDNKQWYADNNIPWRRGYLLHGVPGSGKSSIIIELAKKINYNVCFLSLTDVSDTQLLERLIYLADNSIVVLEEIDTVFSDRKSNVDNSTKNNELTLGGVLNVIDGLVAKEGRIIMMTTNHPEKLDAALIRPGRIDKKIEFTNATPEQVKGMLERFFPGGFTSQLVDAIMSESLSMAALQELCILYYGDLKGLEDKYNRNENNA